MALKLLLVTPEYPPDFGGGITTFYRDLVPALWKQGCEVRVLRGSAFVHGAEAYHHKCTSVVTLETARYRKWLERFGHFAMFPDTRCHLAAAFAMHEQADAGEGFDAVEVTDWGLLFLPWVLQTKAQVLVQMHGSTGQIAVHEPADGRATEGVFQMLLERAILAAAPRLSSYSRANIEWWQTVLHRPVHYLPPPLDLKATRVEEKNHTNKWLSVARIQEWKGPQIACAAWELLGGSAPRLEWMGRDTKQLATGESMDSSLRDQFPDTWGRTIQPIGQFSPQQVQQRMGAAKAMLVPSTWDVFNLAAAEAMALSDEELRAIGQNAAATVRERLNPERIAAAKLKLYASPPQSQAMEIGWLSEALLPKTKTAPLTFLSALPLKDLTSYVARRGLTKLWGGQN